MVVTGNVGCILQIARKIKERGSPIEVAHPIDLLDQSYRRGRSEAGPLRSRDQSSSAKCERGEAFRIDGAAESSVMRDGSLLTSVPHQIKSAGRSSQKPACPAEVLLEILAKQTGQLGSGLVVGFVLGQAVRGCSSSLGTPGHDVGIWSSQRPSCTVGTATASRRGSRR